MIERKPFGLTAQELVVIRLLCDGLSNKEIAEALGISSITVKRHLANLCDKLGASSRLEVAVMAISKGIVSVSTNRTAILDEIEVIHRKIEKYVARSRLLVQQLAAPQSN